MVNLYFIGMKITNMRGSCESGERGMWLIYILQE